MTHKWAPEPRSRTNSVQTPRLPVRETGYNPGIARGLSRHFLKVLPVRRTRLVRLRSAVTHYRLIDARTEVARILRYGLRTLTRKRMEAGPRMH